MKMTFDETFKNGLRAQVNKLDSGMIIVTVESKDHFASFGFFSMAKAAMFVSDIKHDHIRLIKTKREI